MIPDDLRYTAEHEWIREEDDAVVVGITDYAQDALGDIVYISLPEVGEDVQAGSPIGELESTKSVSDLFAPVSGVVLECNEALDQTPELVNSDPYGEGWILRLRLADDSALDDLLTAEDYQGQIGG